MPSRLPVLAFSAALLVAGAVVAKPVSLKGAALTKDATVSLTVARATALKARAGEIVSQELEKEAGGSGLRYSFDIKVKGKVFEVGVDAKTGRVLENAAEGAHPD